MLQSFESRDVVRDGVRLRARRAGRGAPLLLHGHPQTLAMWHRVATPLAQVAQEAPSLLLEEVLHFFRN